MCVCVCVCVCMCLCVCVCICVCACMLVHMCTLAYVNTCVCICTYVRPFECVCVCLCVCVCVCVQQMTMNARWPTYASTTRYASTLRGLTTVIVCRATDVGPTSSNVSVSVHFVKYVMYS